MAAKRGNAKAIQALEAPWYPPQYGYLLDWFWELHHRRGSGMNGPASLTWGDLDAWSRLTKRQPTPWDFRVLGRLDDAFFASVAEK